MTEITLEQAIKEDVNIILNNNPKISINVEEYLINILLGNNIRKQELSKFFNNSLFSIIKSIKNNRKVKYNTKNKEEMDTYFSEYLNTINKCLLGFNSLLLQIVYNYCLKNNKNYYNDERKLEEIFDLGSNKNSIEDLFKFLIKEKVCYANQFYIYSLYESLFRHQMSHGWHNFFYYLLSNNNQSNPDWNHPTSSKKKGYIFDDNNKNLYDLRKEIKKKSILDKPNLNLVDYLSLSSVYGNGILEIKFNISLPHKKSYWKNLEEFEPGSTLLYIYDLNGEKCKKSDGSYWTIDLISEFEKKEKNNEFMYHSLSLNNLIKNIKITIRDLLESKIIS